MAQLTEHTTEELLELILAHMQRMDKRDRMRTIAAGFRSGVVLLFWVFAFWSSWYLYAHSAELIKGITDAATQQMMHSFGK